MYKIIIFLFLFLFDCYAFTEIQTFNNRIVSIEKKQNNMNLNIQKINEIKLENIDNNIIKLENEINNLKKYEKELIQLKLTMDYNEKISSLKDGRISDIHSSIDRFSYVVATLGILITIVVLIFSWNFKQIARKEAEDAIKNELKDWMKEKGIKILNQEAQPLLDLIREDRERYSQTFNDLVKNFSNISSENKRQLFFKCEKIKLKQEKDYDDWYTLAVNEFYNKEYKKSYNYLLKARELATDNYQKIEAIIGIGATLESLGKIDDSIKICNETINQYKNSEDDIVISKIIRITIHKAYRYCLKNDYEQAIKIYSDIFMAYGSSKNKEILKEVAFALCSKVELFIILNKDMPHIEKDFLEKYAKHNIKFNMRYEILKIIDEAQCSQQEDKIIEWQSKYKNEKLSIWYFNLSEKWSNNIKDQQIRNRIKKYLNIFKKYLKV